MGWRNAGSFKSFSSALDREATKYETKKYFQALPRQP
jgi:hypothetical protein